MIRFKLNGKDVSVDVPGDVPLLWTIREELALTGTKFGCGMGLCGACTVHLDGEAIRSCVTPVSVAAGHQIITIEGLGQAGDHRVQKLWAKMNVAQCGYCQSGQMMSAAALLDKNPNPTAADVDAAMSGNICRCGTYARIRAALLSTVQKP